MSTGKINLAGSNPSGVCITFMTYGEFRIPAELSPLASITSQKLNWPGRSVTLRHPSFLRTNALVFKLLPD